MKRMRSEIAAFVAAALIATVAGEAPEEIEQDDAGAILNDDSSSRTPAETVGYINPAYAYGEKLSDISYILDESAFVELSPNPVIVHAQPIVALDDLHKITVLSEGSSPPSDDQVAVTLRIATTTSTSTSAPSAAVNGVIHAGPVYSEEVLTRLEPLVGGSGGTLSFDAMAQLLTTSPLNEPPPLGIAARERGNGHTQRPRSLSPPVEPVLSSILHSGEAREIKDGSESGGIFSGPYSGSSAVASSFGRSDTDSDFAEFGEGESGDAAPFEAGESNAVKCHEGLYPKGTTLKVIQYLFADEFNHAVEAIDQLDGAVDLLRKAQTSGLPEPVAANEEDLGTGVVGVSFFEASYDASSEQPAVVSVFTDVIMSDAALSGATDDYVDARNSSPVGGAYSPAPGDENVMFPDEAEYNREMPAANATAAGASKSVRGGGAAGFFFEGAAAIVSLCVLMLF